MYVTMEYYSNIFSPIYINMIKTGELSGNLVKALEQAIKYLDDTMTMKKRIKSILVPNLVQFIALLVLLIGGTAIGVPLIQNVFQSVGSQEQLPAVTLWFAGVLNRNCKILVYTSICNYSSNCWNIFICKNTRRKI